MIDRRTAWKHRKIAQGLCRNCGKPAEIGYTACQDHRKKDLTRNLRNKQRAREEGRCPICLGPVIDEGRITCINCSTFHQYGPERRKIHLAFIKEGGPVQF